MLEQQQATAAPVFNEAPPTETRTPPPAGKPALSPRSFEAALAKFTEFRDQMCACADKARADKVNQEMSASSRGS